MTTVYVCPGTADGDKCGIWLTAPGHCWIHPHVALVPQDASALTGASADSYRDLFAQGEKHEAPAANVRNTAGCCDGSGQVHHGSGALSWVTPCRDADCVARREAAWAAECGETPASGDKR
jgi:hypothetical protein